MPNLDMFIARCNEIYPLSDEIKEELHRIFEIVTVPRHTLLLKEGEVCQHMNMVLDGLVRVYYYVGDKEITSRLMSEGYFITSYISYFTQKPGREYMEAYENTTLARVSVKDAQAILRKFPEFNFPIRVLTEYSFFLSEERTVALRSTTAEDRFRFFLNRHPELINRVASRHIASYLGITEETFSRVKSKVLAGKARKSS